MHFHMICLVCTGPAENVVHQIHLSLVKIATICNYQNRTFRMFPSSSKFQIGQLREVCVDPESCLFAKEMILRFFWRRPLSDAAESPGTFQGVRSVVSNSSNAQLLSTGSWCIDRGSLWSTYQFYYWSFCCLVASLLFWARSCRCCLHTKVVFVIARKKNHMHAAQIYPNHFYRITLLCHVPVADHRTSLCNRLHLMVVSLFATANICFINWCLRFEFWLLNMSVFATGRISVSREPYSLFVPGCVPLVFVVFCVSPYLLLFVYPLLL